MATQPNSQAPRVAPQFPAASHHVLQLSSTEFVSNGLTPTPLRRVVNDGVDPASPGSLAQHAYDHLGVRSDQQPLLLRTIPLLRRPSCRRHVEGRRVVATGWFPLLYLSLSFSRPCKLCVLVQLERLCLRVWLVLGLDSSEC